MNLTSIVAIYLLFFAGSAFILLPFGVKTDRRGRGRPPSRATPKALPIDSMLKRHFLKAAILAALLFGAILCELGHTAGLPPTTSTSIAEFSAACSIACA